MFFSISLQGQAIRVGAKHFTEGYIMSEIIALLLEHEKFQVERNYNLGGTMVCFTALRENEIDVYPEYTGTLSAEILKAEKRLTEREIQNELQEKYRLEISETYGFNNTYALVLKKSIAKERNIHSISDLKKHPDLKLGLSYEFLKRQDGWENLSKQYDLHHTPVGLEHGLAYQALLDDQINITDAYSTDGEIPNYDLVLLDDDLHFFPDYYGVSFYRSELPSRAKLALKKLINLISEAEMQQMNAAVLFHHKSYSEVAKEFLLRKKIIDTVSPENTPTQDLLEKTLTHLKLTFVALILAVVIALPLGILLYLKPRFATVAVYTAGLLQTIPSIALLAILLPVTGIGALPAIVALFLYALLPILRNTITGLMSVDPLLKKAADGMGMTTLQKIKWIELPLSVPTILAGIRTAAVINIGTATLAAFIGAGGLGEYIVTGLALNDIQLILKGAIPAALLAIIVEILFETIEKKISPRYLKRQ